MNMKTLLALLTTALLSQSISAATPQHSEADLGEELLPAEHHYHYIFGIGFNNSRVDDDARGISFNQEVDDDGNVFRNILEVKPETQIDMTAMVGMQLKENIAIKATYERWHHSDRTTYCADPLPIETILAVLKSNHAEAKIKYRYDTVNLYLTQALPEVVNIVSHILVGAKWTQLYAKKTAVIDQLSVSGVPFEDGYINNSSQSTFNGVGPLVGLDGHYPLWGDQHQFGQLGLFGQAMFSILIDDVKAKNQFSSRFIASPNQLIPIEINIEGKRDYDHRIVYNNSVKVGLDFQTVLKGLDLRLAAGVQMDYYKNAVRLATGTTVDSDFRKSGFFGELTITV